MRVWRTELCLVAIVLLLTINFSARRSYSSTFSQDKPVNVIVTGTLVAMEGVECQRMIFLNNYHLIGNLQGFEPGDRVTVTGALDMETTCQQGTPLRIISIRAA
jgi:hypothetical protein